MTAYRAIAGFDIRPKMVVILKPGGTPFEVSRVEESVARDFVNIYDTNGERPAGGATHTQEWYAEVVS